MVSVQEFDFQRWVEVFWLVFAGTLSFPYLVARWADRPVLSVVVLAVVLGALLSAWHAYGVSFLWAAVLRPVLYISLMVGFGHAWAGSGVSLKRAFSATVLFGLGVYLLYSVLGAAALALSGVFSKVYLVFGFSNVNHAAGFLLATLLILPGLASPFPAERRAVRHIINLLSVWIAFLLLAIGSRGSFLAWLVVAGLCLLHRHQKQVSGYLRGQLVAVAGGLLLYGLLRIALLLTSAHAFPSARPLTEDSGRIELYLKAWNGALESPWLGHGPLSYAGISGELLGHAHNTILTTLYEVGFVCTALILGILAFMGAVLWRARERIMANPVGLPGLAVLVAFAVHSQFSGLPMVPATMLMVTIAVGFVASSWPMAAPALPPARLITGTLAGAALAACYLFMVISYWQAIDGQVLQKPRFWLQGGTETWLSPAGAQLRTR